MVPVCPKCDVGLVIFNFKGIEVDICPKCHGLWLDQGELEELLHSTNAKAPNPLLTSHGQPGTLPAGEKNFCPRCDARMVEILVEQPGKEPLVLDRCPREHGLWFDADELQRFLTGSQAGSGAAVLIEHLNELFRSVSKSNLEEKQWAY